jgi:hypothetical protein
MREIIYVAKYLALGGTVECIDCTEGEYIMYDFNVFILPWQIILGPIRNVNIYLHIPI